MWTRGVPVEDAGPAPAAERGAPADRLQHVAAMPDVHFGIGATVGSVIPTLKAIIPAAVGVDIGCGMIACKTSLRPRTCRTTWRRSARRSSARCRTAAAGGRDQGAGARRRARSTRAWAQLEPEFGAICRDDPKLAKTNDRQQLGTLGSGNHFIEVCLDEAGRVWFMLHSGSRGVGNAIGTISSSSPSRTVRTVLNLPDRDLAYFEEGARYFGDYVAPSAGRRSSRPPTAR